MTAPAPATAHRAGAYLAESATRAGYRTLAQPVSAPGLGSGGWMQQLNFITFGVLACLPAAGWRAALAPGRGAWAFPVLHAVAGAGLVMDGLFTQDPSGGYPPGARAAAPTVPGQRHTLCAVITVLARLAATSRPTVRARRHDAAARRAA